MFVISFFSHSEKNNTNANANLFFLFLKEVMIIKHLKKNKQEPENYFFGQNYCKLEIFPLYTINTGREGIERIG